MSDTFEIPVTYKNTELRFKGKYLRIGYTHKFIVDVRGITVSFEHDEEGNYRAVIGPLTADIKIDINLLQEIATTLDSLIK